MPKPSTSQGAGPRPHVTLIRPPLVAGAAQWSTLHTPPLGIAYLAGTLRAHGIPVSAIDAMSKRVREFVEWDGYAVSGMTINEVLARIDAATEVIGISCMFTQDWPYVRELVRAVGARFPAALLVVGGEHASALPELCLRECPEVDLCVLGEGEETLLEVVCQARDRNALARVPGIAFLDGDELVRTPPRARIREVSEIPAPAWELFPMEVYLDQRHGFGVYRGRTMVVLATRGCPYRCTFCSNATMYGTRWIAREPDDVLDEIQGYIDRFGAENFDFYDLTMIVKRQWILDFCRRIEERRMQFTWQLPSGTRTEVIDDEVARALYRTGCRNLAFAPESGSEATLRSIRKRVDLERLTESARVAIRNGLVIRLSIIIGFPDETRAQLLETLRLVWRLALLGVQDAAIFVYSAYPGTELFDRLRQEGAIPRLDRSYFRSLLCYREFRLPRTYNRHMSAREIAFWRFFGIVTSQVISLLSRPRRIARLVRHVRRQRSETILEQRLGDLLQRRAATTLPVTRQPAGGTEPTAGGSAAHRGEAREAVADTPRPAGRRRPAGSAVAAADHGRRAEGARAIF